MPLYNFATYADVREEWAIEAKDLNHAKTLIGDDPSGNWLDAAFHLEAELVERRDEFVLDDDDQAPAVEEITPAHWAWRSAHRERIEHSLRQNIAAISGEFHTHRLCNAFYDQFGRMIDGFVGQFELCIAMAQVLTDWEVANGLGEAYANVGVPWIEVVEDFVETVLERALETGAMPEPAQILPTIQVFSHLTASAQA